MSVRRWMTGVMAVAIVGVVVARAEEPAKAPARPEAGRDARVERARAAAAPAGDFEQMMRRFGEAYKRGATEEARDIARRIRAGLGRGPAPAARPNPDARARRGAARPDSAARRPEDRPRAGVPDPGAMRERIRNALRDAWQKGDRAKAQEIIQRARALRQRLGAQRPGGRTGQPQTPRMQRGEARRLGPGAPGMPRPDARQRWGRGMRGMGPGRGGAPVPRFGRPDPVGPGFGPPAARGPGRSGPPSGPLAGLRGGLPRRDVRGPAFRGPGGGGGVGGLPRRNMARPPFPQGRQPGRGFGRV